MNGEISLVQSVSTAASKLRDVESIDLSQNNLAIETVRSISEVWISSVGEGNGATVCKGSTLLCTKKCE